MITTYYRDYTIGKDHVKECLATYFDMKGELVQEAYEFIKDYVNNKLPGSFYWEPVTSEITGDVEEKEDFEPEEIQEWIKEGYDELENNQEFIEKIEKQHLNE